MPNRIIKDSIRTSDSINSLSWFEECLFYRLIVSCDDYGLFDGRTAIIKGSCFPLKDGVTTKNIENALSKLVSAGLVKRYIVDGKPYLSLPTWEQHQNIRAHKSKYPKPDESNMNTSECNCMQVNTDVPVIQSESKSELESKSYTGDVRLDSAILDFIEHRRKMRKPMTNRAIELMISKLKKLGKDTDEQIDIINQSIERGWQGVFPLEAANGKQKSSFNNFKGRDYSVQMDDLTKALIEGGKREEH